MKMLFLKLLVAGLVPFLSYAKDRAFKPLFSAADYSGWTGDTNAFELVTDTNGVVEVRSVPMKWGDMYTTNQYSDFVLKFEYLVGEYGNNGIGLRVKYPCRNASFDGGFQVVLRDDVAYIGQEDWRNDASIYGVLASKNTNAKAPDQWNSEQIYLKGGRLKISVNGVEVLRANLDALKPADGRPHTGLGNRTGHIALLARKSRTVIRNLKIKPLK